MLSTKDLSDLPKPAEIKIAMRHCAIIDIIMCDEVWIRSFTFDPNWSEGVAMAKYDNGGGDNMFVFFTADTAVIKGFDHESPVSPYAQDEFEVWPGIYDDLPCDLLALLDDPAISKDHVTFCVWHTASGWQSGDVVFSNNEDDGSSFLLGVIYKTAEEYLEWAKFYFEQEISKSAVEAVYEGKTVDAALISELNPLRNVKKALAELEESGLRSLG